MTDWANTDTKRTTTLPPLGKAELPHRARGNTSQLTKGSIDGAHSAGNAYEGEAWTTIVFYLLYFVGRKGRIFELNNHHAALISKRTKTTRQ